MLILESTDMSVKHVTKHKDHEDTCGNLFGWKCQLNFCQSNSKPIKLLPELPKLSRSQLCCRATIFKMWGDKKAMTLSNVGLLECSQKKNYFSGLTQELCTAVHQKHCTSAKLPWYHNINFSFWSFCLFVMKSCCLVVLSWQGLSDWLICIWKHINSQHAQLILTDAFDPSGQMNLIHFWLNWPNSLYEP